jgi:hypothetical protein
MKLQALALVGAIAALAALAGCETMSAEECSTADWAQLGYNDANSNGTDGFANRAESCAEKGISADNDAYRRGFEDGIRNFCQPERGFEFARRGSSFNGYCPADLDSDFRYAYADGRRVYELEQDLDEARRNVDNAERRRDAIDQNIRAHEDQLQAATTEAERRQIRGDIERLRRERRDANDDIRVAQEQLPVLQYQMNILRAELGHRWGSW